MGCSGPEREISMTSERRGAGDPGVVRRFHGGGLPIAIVCLLLWGLSLSPDAGHAAVVAVFGACGIVLWFGWNSIRRSVATKWLGVLLALFLGLVLGLYALGISFLVLGIGARLLLALFPLFLLALPFFVWDLFFRAPFKGRFARARAERRHLRS
jgi:hypothetical protein